MQANFSPSVNIVRDTDKSFHYIPTNNSRNIYQQIASNFRSGVHSFNIIGSYGTGKSAFLLAFIKHLTGEQNYFQPVNGQFNGCKKFRFLNLVGFSGSFIEALATELDVEPSEKKVLSALKKEYLKLQEADECLILLVDEFGKFLEYAAEHDPDKELYFIQQVAEYANDPGRNFLFLITLHQNFDAYALGLKDTQRKEWEKVKGRLKELTFNEPVEQLLNLAADHISQSDFENKVNFDPGLLKLINDTGAFNLLNEVNTEFAEKLFPFDLLSAMSLTIALQRYGQNERSLFSFLQTEEAFGLHNFSKSGERYYNLSSVYDYLQYNYYSTLTSKFNPDYFKWFMLRNSLERVEVEFTDEIDELQKLIKAIGLLDILGSEGAKINGELIDVYAQQCLGIENAQSLIRRLEEKKIIRYQAFRHRFKLFEGTDIDIEQILEKARREIGPIANLPVELKPFFKLNYVPAKAITLERGTPRYFRFEITEEPILKFENEDSEIDGIINLLFSPSSEIEEVRDEPIVYGVFLNSQQIVESLKEIRALEKALKEVGEDKVARNELGELKHNQIEALNHLLNEQLYGKSGQVNWYRDGGIVQITSRRSFNQMLSEICREIYDGAPNFRNELMNKTKVSSSIHFAKKQYVEALIENWTKPNLGFEGDQMPPEKTIYFTLLQNTGIHKQLTPFTADFGTPDDESFKMLWQASFDFLNSARVSRRNLTEFIDILSKKPFKLKDGFIEFWLITYLFIKREEFALFKEGRYIPLITKEVAELFMKEAKKYEIKTFNIEGVKLDLFNKYRELTQQSQEEKVTGSGFQETARPFLVFFKKLPPYSQRTKALSQDTLAFRDVIENAKELEKTFFEDLPTCFGYSVDQLSTSQEVLDEFVSKINTSIAELRSAEEELLNRVEQQLLKSLGITGTTKFESYQSKIQKRYSSIRINLLYPRQKSLLTRIKSKIPDRQAWLNSIVQTVLGKQLKEMTDTDEHLLNDRLSNAFRELDNLVELSQLKFNEETEEAFKIEISGFEEQPLKRNIILSKEQKQEALTLEEQLRKFLGKSKNKQVNQAVLIKVLQEILKNDKS